MSIAAGINMNSLPIKYSYYDDWRLYINHIDLSHFFKYNIEDVGQFYKLFGKLNVLPKY